MADSGRQSKAGGNVADKVWHGRHTVICNGTHEDCHVHWICQIGELTDAAPGKLIVGCAVHLVHTFGRGNAADRVTAVETEAICHLRHPVFSQLHSEFTERHIAGMCKSRFEINLSVYPCAIDLVSVDDDAAFTSKSAAVKIGNGLNCSCSRDNFEDGTGCVGGREHIVQVNAVILSRFIRVQISRRCTRIKGRSADLTQDLSRLVIVDDDSPFFPGKSLIRRFAEIGVKRQGDITAVDFTER